MPRPTPHELNEARKRKVAAERRTAEEMARLHAEKEQAEAERIDQGLARLRDLEERAPKIVQLASVLDGYYREMDKLSKKDPVAEVTELIFGKVNKLITETKAALRGDPFIDGVDVFVAAGERPQHRDVLFVLAEIRQGIERLEAERESLATTARVNNWEKLSDDDDGGW